MILDSGILSIFRETDAAESGKMPTKAYTRIYVGWFGELSFETSPAHPTEGRQEKKTDARVRILQNRAIKQNDIVILEQAAAFSASTGVAYKITRAYHGQDGAEPISDLTLEVLTP